MYNLIKKLFKSSLSFLVFFSITSKAEVIEKVCKLKSVSTLNQIANLVFNKDKELALFLRNYDGGNFSNFHIQKLLKACAPTDYCGAQIPWLFSFSQFQEVQSIGLMYTELLIKINLTNRIPDSIDKEKMDRFLIDEYFKKNIELKITENDKAELDELISKIKKSSNSSFFNSLSPLVKYFCLDYNENSKSCFDSISKAVDIVKPAYLKGSDFKRDRFVDSVGFTTPDVYRRVLTDIRYIKVLRNSNLDLIEILKYTREKKVISKNIVDILTVRIDEFFPDNDQKLQVFWDLLAIISSRAGSFSLTLPFIPEGYHAIIREIMAFYSISSEINIRNYLLTSKQFFMPHEVSGNCFEAQMYHFWMSGFVSYSLKKNGFSDKNSIISIHLLGILYDFFPSTAYKKFKILSIDDGNRLRQKVLSRNFGSIFGIFSYSKKLKLSLNWNKGWAMWPELQEKEFSEKEYNFLNDFNKYNYFFWKSIVRPHNFLSTLKFNLDNDLIVSE